MLKVVWLALLYTSSSAPVTVVEVATKADCLRVLRAHARNDRSTEGACVEVQRR